MLRRVLDEPLKKQDMIDKKINVSLLYMLFSILFCVCLIAANVFVTKQFQIGMVSVTGSLIVFPISYIINDCVCEVWGFAKTRLLIWVGFAMNFLFVMLGLLCDVLPGADYWHNDEGFHAIFGLAPRAALASFVAFLAGSFVNAYIMSRMKIMSNGRHFSLRAIVSTVFGESIDSLVFFPLALLGVVPTSELPLLMVSQVALKTVYEIIILPVTIKVVNVVKRMEDVDEYDNDADYNILKIFKI